MKRGKQNKRKKKRNMYKPKEKPKPIQKISFPWITIQDLVENDETTLIKHKLINMEMSNENGVHQPDAILLRFCIFFNYCKYFKVEPTQNQGIEDEKKSNKKKKSFNVHEFRKQNENLLLDSDFKMFELNESYSYKSNINFKHEICQYLYIFFWCMELLKAMKSGKKINNLLLLDAILSINRLMKKRVITNPKYQIGFEFMQNTLNKIVNPCFYDLLFANPHYLIDSSFQSIASEIKLYKEQTDMIFDIIRHIDTKTPLLYGNQHPTGQGKTFSVSPLTKLLSTKYNNTRTVLFACSNEFVRNQVSADIMIAGDLHLWLAKNATIIDKNGQNRNIHVLRPYKRCYPSNWKKKYKDTDERKLGSLFSQWEYYTKATQKPPNIIVTDLECCYELLKMKENKDQVLHQEFVAYIDEFITDETDAKVMSKIVKVLPPVSVLLSSVFPQFQNIPKIVSSFCEKHETIMEKSCKRVSSRNIRIPVAILDPNGNVRFPHHYCHSIQDIHSLLDHMRDDPRIRRSYPSSYVYYISKHLQDYLPNELLFCNTFKNIGEINQNESCEYMISLLLWLTENIELLPRLQEYCPNQMKKIRKEEIFCKDTHNFDVEGKTLCMFTNPTTEVIEMTKTLFQDKKKIDLLLKNYDNEKKAIERELSTLSKIQTKQVKSSSKEEFKSSKGDKIQDLETKLETLRVTIPPNMILNHVEHFKRFHGNDRQLPSTVFVRNCPVLQDDYFTNFTDETIYQLFSGIGTFCFEDLTKHQRFLVMKLYKSFLFFVSGKKIIYGTNLANLCNIYLPYEICKSLRLPELFQLLGRVGRPGSSNHATIITDHEETVERLFSLDESYEKETLVEMHTIV